MTNKRYTLLVIFFVLVVCAGCATVPFTDRMQLSFIPEADVLSLSDESYQEILTTAAIVVNTPEAAAVERVGTKIAAAAEAFLETSGRGDQIKDYSWEFKLVKDDATANAFCLPGGKIVVYTGILSFAKDDTGLAVVMGHEVAHALAHHGQERLSQQVVMDYAGQKFSQLVKTQPEKTKSMLMTAYGVGTNVGVLLPYSRMHEKEADHIGLILMARAGYDPNAAIPFWERMMGTESGRNLEILSTHPATPKRIEALRQFIPEAMDYYAKK